MTETIKPKFRAITYENFPWTLLIEERGGVETVRHRLRTDYRTGDPALAHYQEPLKAFHRRIIENWEENGVLDPDPAKGFG